MKKILFGLFALSFVSMAAETNLYFRTGADFGGEFEVIKDEYGDFTKKDTDDFAWEIAVEATKEIYPSFELGLGIAYQDHGKPKKFVEVEDSKTTDYDVDEYKMCGYTSIPLYLTAKYNFKAVNNFVPYIKANIGYSFNDSNDDFKIHTVKYNTATNQPVKDPYIENPVDEKGKIEIKNGLYYGFGGGFEYNNFTMDLMYQVNKAKAEMDFYDDYKSYKVEKDFDYSRFTLSFGYKFTLDF